MKHCGIAMLPEREARAALEQGLLVPVLAALEPKPLAIHGIYQSWSISLPRCGCSLMSWPATWHEGAMIFSVARAKPCSRK